MSFSFESGGGGNWSTSYDFGDSLSFDIDFDSWQAELSDFDAIGNDPFGFDVDLGSLSHDVVAFDGVGATDVVTTGPVGSTGSTTYSSGVDSAEPLAIALNTPTAVPNLVADSVDPAADLTAGLAELRAEVEAGKGQVLQEVAESTEAYISGVSDERVTGPGISRSVVAENQDIGLGQGPSFAEDIQLRALDAVEGTLDPGLVNPLDFGGSFVGDEFQFDTDLAADAYAAAYAAQVQDVVGRGLDLVETSLLAISVEIAQNPGAATQFADAVAAQSLAELTSPLSDNLTPQDINPDLSPYGEEADEPFIFSSSPASVSVDSLSTTVDDRIQAYGANPLELVEDVARLAIPGGGMIIDTAENLIAGQDPFTAVVNAAEEGIDRVANFAAGVIDIGETALTTVAGVRASDFSISSTLASVADGLSISDLVQSTAESIAQSTVNSLPGTAQAQINDAYNVAVNSGNFGELNAVLAEYDLDRRAISILYPEISNTALNELVDQGLVFGQPTQDAAAVVNNGSTTITANTRRGAVALDSTVAAVSNSQNDSDQILAQSQIIAQTTVNDLPASVSTEIGDAYALAVDSGNFGPLNAVLARNNLNREAINLLFPEISNTALNQLVAQGLVFGQPAQDAAVVVNNGSTTNTGGAVTQAQTSTQSTVNAAVANSQNNSATVAANADRIATETANNTSAETQQDIVAAYESALQTGNFTTLNRILADNNLSQAAVQKLFPQLTQTEITDLVARGLVFGQPAADPAAGGATVRTTDSPNDVLNNIGGAIEDVDSAIRGGADAINQVTNIINTAAAVPGIFVTAAAAAEQAASAVEGFISAITAPPPVPQDLIPGVSAEALLLGNDPFGFDEDLLANQNATIGLAQQQAALQARYNEPATPDWRVRLQLAPGAQYLYKDPQPGILAPLFATDGVLFPYTPNIETSYAAIYDKYDLTHSNYRGYFYRNSAVNEVNIRGTFTAQDTQEANYLLAVIHFFRSVTKMFYGQDDLRGAPPPLVYLSGFGDFQFNEHPCLVSNFSYSLPSDVDYIRALAPNNYGTNLLSRRSATSGIALLAESVVRLTQVLPGASSLPSIPDPSNINQSTSNTSSATYVPTKMEINVTLLPTNTRSQVSQQFSLKQFANGSLLKGGFW